MATKKPRTAYAVDWMQLFCSVPAGGVPEWEEKISPNRDKNGNHRTYKLVQSLSFIKGYEWQRTVLWGKYTLATIAAVPKDERYRTNGAAIKLNNAVLYVADWYFILTDILATLGWVPENITRVDLCADFNFFMNGLAPETFLRKYVTKTKASYLRKGSNKFCLYAQKDMRCTVYDSIRWGSRQSGVSVYMYNKTKELDEVKDKPWIREHWKSADLSSTKPVWRVEISISSQGLGLKDMYNNLCHNLFIDELMTDDLCRDMFRVYAAKYFSFVATTPGAKRKRDLKDVPLLDLETPSLMRPVTLQESHDTGRMERIVSNKLAKLYQYIAARDYEDKYIMLDALSKTMQLYNWHHNIKREVSSEFTAMETHITDVLCSVFDLPEKKEMRKSLMKARTDVEEWQNLIRKLSKQALLYLPHAQKKSPPPRTAVRNSPDAPTSTQ